MRIHPGVEQGMQSPCTPLVRLFLFLSPLFVPTLISLSRNLSRANVSLSSSPKKKNLHLAQIQILNVDREYEGIYLVINLCIFISREGVCNMRTNYSNMLFPIRFRFNDCNIETNVEIVI